MPSEEFLQRFPNSKPYTTEGFLKACAEADVKNGTAPNKENVTQGQSQIVQSPNQDDPVESGNSPQKDVSDTQNQQTPYVWGKGWEPSKEIIEEFEKKPKVQQAITHMSVRFI